MRGRRVVDQDIDLIRPQHGIVGHERHRAIDDADQHHRFLARDHGHVHRIQRQIRVAGQGQPFTVFVFFNRHRLREDIDAMREGIAHGMRVVGVDVIALDNAVANVGARLEEKLAEHHVRRQLAAPGIERVIHVRIVAKDALHKGIEETALDQAASLGPVKRERGDDSQLDRRIVFRPLIKRVDPDIRLADTERHRQHQLAPHFLDQGINGGFNT